MGPGLLVLDGDPNPICATESWIARVELSSPAMAVVIASIHRARSASLSACNAYVLLMDTTRKQNRMFESSRSGLIVAVRSDTVSFALPCRTSLSGSFHTKRRTSGWSSKASEAELKGVEGGD